MAGWKATRLRLSDMPDRNAVQGGFCESFCGSNPDVTACLDALRYLAGPKPLVLFRRAPSGRRMPGETRHGLRLTLCTRFKRFRNIIDL
jgi:hypothetical protein